MTTTETERTDYINGLHALADALTGNPDLPLPWTGTKSSTLDVFVDSKGGLQEWVRALPGRKDKEVTPGGSYGFNLQGTLQGLHIRVYAPREEVCIRRVVGTETVTKRVATTFEEQTFEQDIVEWDCTPVLGAS